MKYFDVKTVVNAYNGFQDCMTNKSWGYLALLKGSKSSVHPSTPYEVDLNIVSNFLEGIFNLSQSKKVYEGGRFLYVVFSNKWDKYFNDQGKYTPNIYDLIVWAYRRRSFPDSITEDHLLKLFSNDFNIPTNVIQNSFNTKKKILSFADSLYSENDLKSELGKIGVDVSKNNIDAKKQAIVAAPGEISRGPFIQTLYAGLDITDYVIILQSNYYSLYGAEEKKNNDWGKNSTDNTRYLPYLTALRTKPFMLLAGISGTGKSRIVREMAKACWKEGDEEYGNNHPRNFCMVQVKPNWHDSSELIGYVTRISGTPEFVAGDFIKFVVKAWYDEKHPYFMLLDEMNLAPVEQYFAEYLSVIESRKARRIERDGEIITEIYTDPILKASYHRKEDGSKEPDEWYVKMVDSLLVSCPNEKLFAIRQQFLEQGISIPQNLFVVGTVNMDETTFSFSRKVLDRAMTIEMNEVDLHGGLEKDTGNEIGYIADCIIGDAAEGCDVYAENKELCDEVLAYLEKVNAILERTPFKIAYRTRNEFLMYAVNRKILAEDSQLWQTLDEMTSMKILSRIEGDEERTQKVLKELKDLLKAEIEDHIPPAEEGKTAPESISAKKIEEMLNKLSSGFTSYWA